MPIEQTHDFKKPDAETATDLLRRATVAWFQSGETVAPASGSGFKLHKGLGYVVLNSPTAVLAVYRVRPDNYALRRMKRWPKGLAS